MCELINKDGIEVLKPEQLLERGCFINSAIIETHDPSDFYESELDQMTFDPQEIEETKNQGNEVKMANSFFSKNWKRRNLKEEKK